MHATHALRTVLDRIAAGPGGPVRVGVCAPGGYGKSALLAELRRLPDVDAVLVDDAHRVPEAQLRRLVQDLPDRLVVAYRPWPRPAALTALVGALDGQLPLPALSAGQVHEALTDTGVRPGSGLAETVRRLTGGVPALVDRVAEAVCGTPGEVDTVPDTAAATLRRDLDALEPRLQLVLLAADTGVGLDVDLLGRLLGGDADLGVDAVAAVRATGLVGPDGTPVPLVRQALAALVPVERRMQVRRRLVELQVDRGGPVLPLVRPLLGTVAADPALAAAFHAAFRAAADEALPEEPALAARLYAAVAATSRPAPAVRVCWSRAAALAGDLDGALRIADEVAATGEPADRAEAAHVAAAALAHRGQAVRSVELFRWSGSAALATVGLIGMGQADPVPPQDPPAQPPALVSAALTLMADGVRGSVSGSPTAALAALVRAADLLAPAGRTAVLPDSPAALAALVALHSGEHAVAASVLARAVEAGVGGELMAARHRLLQAWVLLTRGDLAGVRELRAGFPRPPREPRDRLFWVALELGLARRDGDAARLRASWPEACEAVLRHPADLFTLLPLGELAVCAARLGDHDRMAPHVADGYALLDRLGAPALWTAPLRWSSLHAAIVAQQPAAARGHLTELARAAPNGGYPRILAAAGECWLEVQAGRVQPAKVERAARGLHDAGLCWDGARLAGYAAARTTDRAAMAALLDCARVAQGRVSQGRAVQDRVAPDRVAPDRLAVPRQRAPESDQLSQREREVAALVVAGLTYKEIAGRLYLSPKTVEHHVARIRRRLGCDSRADLLARLRHLAGAPHVGM